MNTKQRRAITKIALAMMVFFILMMLGMVQLTGNFVQIFKEMNKTVNAVARIQEMQLAAMEQQVTENDTRKVPPDVGKSTKKKKSKSTAKTTAKPTEKPSMVMAEAKSTSSTAKPVTTLAKTKASATGTKASTAVVAKVTTVTKKPKYIILVKRNNVSMYDKPVDEDSNVVKKLAYDDRLEVMKVLNDGWIKVKSGNDVGYVFYYFTDYADGKKIVRKYNQQGMKATATRGTELWEAPGITSKLIKWVPKGKTMNLIRCKFFFKEEVLGWYLVEIELKGEFYQGYIYGNAICVSGVVAYSKPVNVRPELVKTETKLPTAAPARAEMVQEETTETTSATPTTAPAKAEMVKEETTETTSETSTVAPAKADIITKLTKRKSVEELIYEVKNKRAIKETINVNENLTLEWFSLIENKTTQMLKEEKSKNRKNSKKRTKKNALGIVCANFVNLRSTPRGKIKNCLEKNTELIIKGTKGKWFKVRIKDKKQEGYMYREYVRVNEEEKSKVKTKHAKKNETTDDYKAYAKRQCKEKYHWGEKDCQDLVKLWNRESGWNPNCVYNNCYGIPQRKADAHGIDANYKNNWKAQIDWGLQYIKDRYGNPTNAWAHFCAHNWY